MTKPKKVRLDTFLLEHYPHLSRTYLQSLIMQGKVRVNEKVETKAGTLIALDATIVVDAAEPKYVSRGGFKLEAALDAFAVEVKDLVALDAGLSTGGFSDCLLQRGIKKIYGIDVGTAQVHEKIARDSRVIVMEQTNLRHLQSLPEQVDLATLDRSFISLLKVIDAVIAVLKPQGKIIALIKPQFEAERRDIKKGGIVDDPKVHQKVIEKIKVGMHERGFEMRGLIESPISGGTSGNKEFLALFEKKIKAED